MIKIDRKTCRDILRVTTSYKEWINFSHKDGGYSLNSNSAPVVISASIPLKEVSGSLLRLEASGLIKKISDVWGDDMIFVITPELLHYKAFWFDRFTKTYLAGFISGVGVSVISGLLIHFLTGFF